MELKQLIEINPQGIDEAAFKALRVAIVGNKLEEIRKILNHDPELLTATINGDNCLHIIASSNSVTSSTLRTFERYVALNTEDKCVFYATKNREGYTAIQIAVKAGHNERAALMLAGYESLLLADKLICYEHKITDLINMQDEYGRTIMHDLQIPSSFHFNFVKFFASKGANLDLPDNESNMPFDTCGNFLKQCYENGKPLDASTSFEFAKIYAENGANPEQPNRAGETLISLAQNYSVNWAKEYTLALKKLYKRSIKIEPYQAVVNKKILAIPDSNIPALQVTWGQ
jgi:ankyrin repeat protein